MKQHDSLLCDRTDDGFKGKMHFTETKTREGKLKETCSLIEKYFTCSSLDRCCSPRPHHRPSYSPLSRQKNVLFANILRPFTVVGRTVSENGRVVGLSGFWNRGKWGLKEFIWQRSFLGWFVGSSCKYKRFLSCLGCSSQFSTKHFSSMATFL